MLEMVVDYLLHIHLEQGLGPFHLEKRKEKRPCSMSLQLVKQKKSEQQCALMDEMYVLCDMNRPLKFLISAST